MATDEVRLKIYNGYIKGSRIVSPICNAYYCFHKIPYALCPEEELKFMEPVPMPKWDACMDCTFKPEDELGLLVEDDCLYLNVYTPEISKNFSVCYRPVMMFIPGETLLNGYTISHLYGPDYFMREDVVLVTVSYRKGVLGFLQIKDPQYKCYGNACLKDLLEALKWVQINIKYFGGDDQNITVFGQGCGASYVHLLLISPMAKNMFQRAIMQSGCAFDTQGFGQAGPLAYTKKLGINFKTELEVLNFLSRITISEFLVTEAATLWYPNDIPFMGPTAEPSESRYAFLRDCPINIIKESSYINDVPIIMGYNSNEGLIVELIGESVYTIRRPDFFVPLDLGLMTGGHLSYYFAKLIKTYYYGERVGRSSASTSTSSSSRTSRHREHITQQKFHTLVTDNNYFRPQYIAARVMRKRSSVPVYFYRFSMDTRMNVYKDAIIRTGYKGACHGDELGYMFKTPVSDNYDEGSVEDMCIRKVTRMWANFARQGSPNGENKDLIDVTWEPMREDSFNYLDIGEKLTPGVNPNAETIKFWDSLYAATPQYKRYDV